MEKDLFGLSVAIIAKNAEKTIARTLQSVASIANEIIVVINDCTDDTKNISEGYGATVIEHPWEGFREQKNFAIAQAKCNWILFLDADEALDDRLIKNIKNFLNTPHLTQEYDGVVLSRKTIILGKWISHGSIYPDYLLRLFKNGKGKFIGGRVHERLAVEGKKYRLSGDILHFTCESLHDFTVRNIRYAELGAQDLYAQKKRRGPMRCIFHTLWKFFKNYILKLGFLDGEIGFYIAYAQSFYTLHKYFSLQEIYKNKH